MRKLYVSVFALLLALGLAPSSGIAQDFNPIEFFPAKDVDPAIEKSVVYEFTEALAMPQAIIGGGTFVTQDIVAWQYATGNFVTPKEGEAFKYSYTNRPAANPNARMTPLEAKWIKVTANENGVLEGRETQGSYVYATYTSPKEQILLLDGRGYARVYVNGQPYEGDHYDFGYTITPVKMKKGVNEFVFTPGRFGRVKAKLIEPTKPVMFTVKDILVPDMIIGENDEKWGAVRIINATNKPVKNFTITCKLESGEEVSYTTDQIIDVDVKKAKFKIPGAISTTVGDVPATLILKDSKGKELDSRDIIIKQRSGDSFHERTYVSNVEGSVQYYSFVRSTTPGKGQGLILNTHGAGVEAVNLSRSFIPKDWTDIAVPTNRRPFGFDWEEWGRLQALEVLADAKRLREPDETRINLIGHSMGGHGAWYLGTTYPDKFAAVVPVAGYPERVRTDAQYEGHPHYAMLARAVNPGRVLTLKRNLLQSGVHILHGDKDTVVPTSNARMMREVLAEFHPDFAYYELKDGVHWSGPECLDVVPVFSYMEWHRIPAVKDVKHIEFHTASPNVSPSDYWIRIDQQEAPLDFSTATFDIIDDNTIKGTVENVTNITFLLSQLELKGEPTIEINGQKIQATNGKDITLQYKDGKWNVIDQLNKKEKYAERYGTFKQAINNNVVLVYATGGTAAENEWYKNKARFDSNTFMYRANASIDIISDKEFDPAKYADRNVILYGNASNNSAWNKVLSNCPITVKNGEIIFGKDSFKGDDLATYFIYPRTDSDIASVGVVAGTGVKGMKATYANDYIMSVTGFPDVMIFNVDMLKDGLDKMVVSGFFGSDWSIENGDFAL